MKTKEVHIGDEYVVFLVDLPFVKVGVRRYFHIQYNCMVRQEHYKYTQSSRTEMEEYIYYDSEGYV